MKKYITKTKPVHRLKTTIKIFTHFFLFHDGFIFIRVRFHYLYIYIYIEMFNQKHFKIIIYIITLYKTEIFIGVKLKKKIERTKIRIFVFKKKE